MDKLTPGTQFGRWTILSVPTYRPYLCVCRCACGQIRQVSAGNLTHHRSLSCGCLRRERSAEEHLIHGETRHARQYGLSPEYRAWKALKFRYQIKVCAVWRRNFSQFLADVGRKPSPQHRLTATRGAKSYGPKTVSWQLPSEKRSGAVTRK